MSQSRAKQHLEHLLLQLLALLHLARLLRHPLLPCLLPYQRLQICRVSSHPIIMLR